MEQELTLMINAQRHMLAVSDLACEQHRLAGGLKEIKRDFVMHDAIMWLKQFDAHREASDTVAEMYRLSSNQFQLKSAFWMYVEKQCPPQLLVELFSKGVQLKNKMTPATSYLFEIIEQRLVRHLEVNAVRGLIVNHKYQLQPACSTHTLCPAGSVCNKKQFDCVAQPGIN